MTERRIAIIETTITEHSRRITDHDGKLETIMTWKIALDESTRVNKKNTEALLKMADVGENLLIALGWLGTASKWIVRVGLALGMMWAAFKLIVTLGHAK